MLSAAPSILVIGLGNEVLTDDAIGPRLSMALKARFKRPEIQFLTAAIGGLEMVELFSRYEKVFIVDAIKTRGGVPGTVYCLKPEDFKQTLHLTNFHDVNFLVGLDLAKRLGIKLPSEIHILAVEIVEDLVFSEEFTPEIQAKYPEVLNEIFEYIDGKLVLNKT